jgi:hypothetical protein
MATLTEISSFLSTGNLFGLLITTVEATAVLYLTFLLIERVLIEAYGTEKFAERLKPMNAPTIWLLVVFCLVVALRVFQMLFAG